MKYIFWKPSNQETPETLEKREILEKNIDLLKKYNNFIASIIKLEESNIKLNNIYKELEKNKKNFKYVKILIIPQLNDSPMKMIFQRNRNTSNIKKRS